MRALVRFSPAIALTLVVAACTANQVVDTATTVAAPPTSIAATAPPDDGGTGSGLATLDGLPFGDFVEESYALLLVRQPEFLTSLGVAAQYGMRNDQLNDLSPGYLEDTQALESEILNLLRTYDRSTLTAEEQLTFDTFEWYLDQRQRGHRFAYHDYPVHHFVNSYNFNLILFLTEEHPLSGVEDAEDYIARLAEIDRQVDQLLERLRISEEMGVVPPSIIVRWTIGSLENDLGGTRDLSEVRVRRLPLYQAFADRLQGAAGVDEGLREELLGRVEAALSESFVPAWIALIEHMEEVEPLAGSDAGVWRLPDGDSYYAYLLRENTSTNLTADEIHQLGLEAVTRVEAELREAFVRLGYPEDASLNELRQRAAGEAGFLDGSRGGGRREVIATYEQLIVDAGEAVRGSFNLWPAAEVGIVEEPAGQGGYYVPGSVDGSRPGAFHAGVGGRIAAYTMPTITYHEAVPGHHTQIAIAQELDLPTFRRFVRYNGFVEGWALYAERLAAEHGLYSDDPYGDIGRLELELLRAVRLVVDTGLHARQWTRAEAREYMEERIAGWTHEVERYIVLPGQATGYMIGMQILLDLRTRASEAGVDLAGFHDLVLSGGNLPLAVLEKLVEDSL